MALVTIVLLDTEDGKVEVKAYSEPALHMQDETTDQNTPAQLAGIIALGSLMDFLSGSGTPEVTSA